MPYHPSGILVDIVGINASDKGRSCEEHASCGSVFRVDTLVQFRLVQIWCNGQEETALAVYWVMDGIDRCRVVSFHDTSSNTKLHIMENWLNLLNLLQIQTALLIGPNCTGVLACAELLWLRQRWGKMKKMFPQVLMMRTMMEWMTRKETTIKKTTKPTILPQKEALLQERKGKFCPFDSCVLKLNDILPYFVALCCSEVLVICCCY